MLGDALDGAALAGGVASFEDHEDAGPAVGDPLLHLHELLLEAEELGLVELPWELRPLGSLAHVRLLSCPTSRSAQTSNRTACGDAARRLASARLTHRSTSGYRRGPDRRSPRAQELSVRRHLVGTAITIAVLAAAVGGTTTLASVAAPASSPVKVAAVGDIACKDPAKNNRQVCRYDDVADGIARRDYDAFLVLGDVQYEYGLYKDFVENYDVHFGRLLPITYPATGNHEYGKSPDAAGYFRYFGTRAPAQLVLVRSRRVARDRPRLHDLPSRRGRVPRRLSAAPMARVRPRGQRRDLHARVLAPSAVGSPQVPERGLDRRLRAPTDRAAVEPAVRARRRRGPRGPQPQLLTVVPCGRRRHARSQPRHHAVRRGHRRPELERLRQLPHAPRHLRPRSVPGVRPPPARSSATAGGASDGSRRRVSPRSSTRARAPATDPAAGGGR